MLSDNIRKYRKLNHMSQDELAEKLDVTRQSISLWETGQTQPSLDNIIALSKLFNISTDDLLSECESKSEDKSESTDTDEADAPFSPRKKNIHIVILIVCSVVIASLVLTIVLWSNGKRNSEDSGKINSAARPSDYVEGHGSSGKIDTTELTSIEVDGKQDQTNSTIEAVSEPIETSTAAQIYPTVVTTTEKNNTAETTTAVTTTTQATNKTPTTQATTTKQTEKAPEAPEPITDKDIYGYLKDFVIENGTINGDYCYYSKPADNYGGYSSEDFTLYYWGDTDTIEFCLHSVLDETFSINFYLYIPKKHTGTYDYTSSYYYRDTGEPLYEARGTITASEFTKNYPLNCNKYIGSTDGQNDFMEMSRTGICDLIDCLKQFIVVENLEYSFLDFGFTDFK